MKLYLRESSGSYREASFDEILHSARAGMRRRFKRGTAIEGPTSAIEFLRLEIGHLDHETFAVLHLDQRHRVIAFDPMFRGSLTGTSVAPGEVVKEALNHKSAALCLSHNHPSGECTPSHADRQITRRLRDALDLVDVRVIDHIIIAPDDHYSFAANGDL